MTSSLTIYNGLSRLAEELLRQIIKHLTMAALASLLSVLKRCKSLPYDQYTIIKTEINMRINWFTQKPDIRGDMQCPDRDTIIAEYYPSLWKCRKLVNLPQLSAAVNNHDVSQELFPITKANTDQEKRYMQIIGDLAAAGGNIILLKTCLYYGMSLTNEIFEVGVKYGQLDVLKWLHEKRCPWTSWTSWSCAGAAENGHFEILKWLHENKCPCSDTNCMYCKV